jgi:hypothetical protein
MRKLIEFYKFLQVNFLLNVITLGALKELQGLFLFLYL